MDKSLIYRALYDSYCKAYSDIKPAVCQSEVNKHWASIKKEKDCEMRAKILMTKWAEVASKNKSSLLNMFAKAIKKKESTENVPINEASTCIALEFTPDSNQFVEPLDDDILVQGTSTIKEADPTPIDHGRENKYPAQTEIKSRLDLINSDLVGLMERDKRKLLSADQEKELDRLKLTKVQLEKKLNALVKDQARGKKRRADTREVLLNHPEVKSKLKIREKAGRPSLQEDQPMLLQTIIDLATCK